MSVENIHIEVAYALPDRQKLMALQVPRGTTAREAVRLSGIVRDFPGIDVNSDPLGIFGQALGVRGMPPAEEYEVQQGDRVEIYRPLIADPKEARKKRAQEAEVRRQDRSSDDGDAMDAGVKSP